jgi:energy-coupling factor transport system ATP-binding protein
MAIIELKAISFTYPGGTKAMNEASLSVESSESLAVIGQNGAGKTTMIKMVNGLLRPTTGEVRLFGADISKTSTAKIARKVGFVFQNPRTQIFLGTVQAEAEFGPQRIGMSHDLVKERVAVALELVGLADRRDVHPYDMTPAERKLLTIASILSMDPQILILDEPTGGLDYVAANRVAAVVEAYLVQGRTVITVTHDMDFVARCFHRVVVMNQGRVVRDGPVHEVFVDHGLLASTHLEPTAIGQLSALCELPRSILSVPEMLHYIENNSQNTRRVNG